MHCDQRRRYTIHYLLSRDGSKTIDAVARQVAAWEQDRSIDDVDPSDSKDVSVSLRQTHLPALINAGFIHSVQDTGEIRLSPDADDFGVHLEVVRPQEIPWSQYYFGLGCVSCALAAALWIDAFPFTLVPTTVWTGLIGFVFTISAAIDMYHERRSKLGQQGRPPKLN